MSRGRAGGGAGEPAGGARLILLALLSAVLGKAVHSLSRIGDELYLEPLEDGVRGAGVRGVAWAPRTGGMAVGRSRE